MSGISVLLRQIDVLTYGRTGVHHYNSGACLLLVLILFFDGGVFCAGWINWGSSVGGRPFSLAQGRKYVTTAEYQNSSPIRYMRESCW